MTPDSKGVAVAGWGEVIKALESGIADNEEQTSELMQKIAAELEDLRWFCERKNAMVFYDPLSAIVLERPRADSQRGYQASDFIHSHVRLSK